MTGPVTRTNGRLIMRNLSPEDFTLLWAGIEGYADGYQSNSQEMARNKRCHFILKKRHGARTKASIELWRFIKSLR
jgi:hypothetical protein